MPDSQSPKTGRTRLRIGCVAGVVILIGAGYYFYCVHQGIRNAYAVGWVGDMVVEHLIFVTSVPPKNNRKIRLMRASPLGAGDGHSFVGVSFPASSFQTHLNIPPARLANLGSGRLGVRQIWRSSQVVISGKMAN